MRWGGRVTRKILGFQAAFAGLAALGTALAAGLGMAQAVAAGGLIGVAGTLFFSRRLFVAAPGATAKQMLRAFHLGAAGKVIVTGALFAVAIAGFRLPFLPLVGGYAATVLGYWLAMPFVAEETGK